MVTVNLCPVAVGVAGNARERLVVIGNDMAVGARTPSSGGMRGAGRDRELRFVVERRRNPRRRAMARLAERGEARSMDRVRRRVVVIDVTSGAVTRRVGVVAANMAFGACNRLMRSGKLEDSSVIEGRGLPCCG